ncbi:hypothetical protein CFP56_043538 [Quercus suber]|uniref:Uncharacterized protein n=1 Tax=Quercus suber TaxID=58331 RepID=A0AAW0IRM3_QUESU
MANRHYYVHHPETTDDEYAERARNNNGKNKKPMISSSDESESALKLNLRESQEGDDHDMDANKFSTTIEVELNPTELAPIIDRFRYSLIIYVHGKKTGYHNLYTRLVRVLALYGPYQLVDLGLGFFLLNISEFLDYNMLLTSAAINASRGQASTSNDLVNSAGHRRLADHTSKIVMSKSADSSSSDDNSPWPQVRPCKQHQRESSGSQRPHVQNQNMATETECDLEMIDQSKPKASVIAESSTELMQRKNPLPEEGNSLSPITEGTLIQPPKDKPPYIPKSLKSEKGLPSEFSMAGSSNSLPQDSSQHVRHQPAQTMVKKACHTIPTQPHGNQPQTLSSETASPRPSPMVKPSIQLYYTGIHMAMVKKDIGNTPITEFSTEIRQTLYSIKSEVASLDIGVSKTAMRNQHAISFLPTVGDFTKNPLQNQQEATYQTCAETVPQTPLHKLLCWKYNGTDNITLIQTMKYLKEHENPSIVLLFGIKSSGNDADQAIEEIGFSGSYLIDPFLFDDGVWLLWKKDVVIEVNSPTSHLIHATVHFLPHPSNRMLCGTGKSSEANAPYAR